MAESGQKILNQLLDRLFAAMVNGPSMNCRPHSSRQRIDLTQIDKFKDIPATAILQGLLGEDRRARVTASAPMPRRMPRRSNGNGNGEPPLTDEERAAIEAWSAQQSALGKLRSITEDARTYEQDTGVHVLSLGFPLLSLPPGSFGGRQGPAARRILAPVALIPLNVTVKAGPRPVVELECRADGADLIMANEALLAWLEQQTGTPAAEVFADGAGTDPWRELRELVKHVAQVVQIAAPATFSAEKLPTDLSLSASPRADDDSAGPSIVPAAVLGLFPLANQGLLRDMQALADGEPLTGPVRSFVSLSERLDPTPQALVPTGPRDYSQERAVAPADPFQTRAVRLARQCRGLVIHGPPGTGKSQTITNIIGDHLSRGQRVLFVCDKRTALDVVANRLEHIGLASLCAVVHDPQRDQRDLYRSIREQLDALDQTGLHPRAIAKLEKTDTELKELHAEMLRYHEALFRPAGDPPIPLHDLIGQWLGTAPCPAIKSDPAALAQISHAQLEGMRPAIREMMARAAAVEYATNPWRPAVGLTLADYLARPMEGVRAAMSACVSAAESADKTADPAIPPFAANPGPTVQATARVDLAGRINALPHAVLPADAIARWATQTPQAVTQAREAIAAASADLSIVRSGTLDAEWSARANPSMAELKSAVDAVNVYIAAFDTAAAKFAHVRAAAPQTPIEMIFQWIGRDAASAGSLARRLDAAQPLADTISAGPPDIQMLAQFRRQPIPVDQLIAWQAAVAEYAAVAGRWYAFIAFGKKKAATPALQYFGLAANAESASKVNQFLTLMRARLELRAVIESDLAKAPLPGDVDDEQLVSLFSQHSAIIRAVANWADVATPDRPNAPVEKQSPIPDPQSDLLHSLIPAAVAGAAPVAAAWGLEVQPDPMRRVQRELIGRLARLRLEDVRQRILLDPAASPVADGSLLDTFDAHCKLLDLLAHVHTEPTLASSRSATLAAMADAATLAAHVGGLKSSPRRAAGILAMDRAAREATLFAPAWIEQLAASLRGGGLAAPLFTELHHRLDTLDGILRTREGLATLAPQVRPIFTVAVENNVSADEAIGHVARIVLDAEIHRRLRSSPYLQTADSQHLQTLFDRYGELQDDKRATVCDSIAHRWISAQKERLLVSTGSRLNAMGADLRRRFTLRGERAMRLRQVVALGRNTEGGDPLFDLRPVWMASPETVAQVFPRQPIFDVIVFDEASQCRLEEAMPVLTRAGRVVIAGDPKQLPPTRFFESAVATSEEESIETDQDLFEAQQSETEDLLGAALSLDIQESYLNVHYRSRSADLIGFSNEYFYGSRLQAIPGHPSRRPKEPPIAFYPVGGTYCDRANDAEADRVVQIVRDLLDQRNAPSIGIACFNLPQRDLIVEKLDEAAEEDPAFGKRLANARQRAGEGSFEGLFVRNLENVQGDERDHIIISTTYGPDANGKFRRNFGPLGRGGGGRRLNVLVTRARHRVHLVTSIPAAAYRTLPPVPAGQVAGGAWLLFAYLAYAERLSERYQPADAVHPTSAAAPAPVLSINPTRYPSPFVASLANSLSRDGMACEAYWGSDGLGIDLTLRQAAADEASALGILCDSSRFAAADDPVEWDIFRTAIHQSQGWTLHRIWTPHFFRDTEGCLAAIRKDLARLSAGPQAGG